MKTTAMILFSLFGVTIASGQDRRLATLAQQKMCAEQAKKAFYESEEGTPIPVADRTRRSRMSAGYTSHYDAKANVCYIMVSEMDLYKDEDGNEILNTTRVYDAFEGRIYADYFQMSKNPPPTCSVKPLGQDEILCKSSAEFESLVEKHFGISTRFSSSNHPVPGLK